MIIKNKTVYIKRTESKMLPGFSEEDYTAKIGSAFAKNSSDTLRGLTSEEEKKYLPSIIGINPTDANWHKATRNYWASLSVPIASDGRKLEVGLKYETEEDAKEGVNGEPINIADWILYKYCLVYGRVANSKEAISNSPKKIRFYLEDKEAELKKEKITVDLNRKAFIAALELEKDKKVQKFIMWIERNLIGDINPDRLTDDEIMINWMRLVDVAPLKIIKYQNDKMIAPKAFIVKALGYNLLTKIPNTETIMYIEDGNTIKLGDTLEEAALFISDPKGETLKKTLEAKIISNPKYLNN